MQAELELADAEPDQLVAADAAQRGSEIGGERHRQLVRDVLVGLLPAQVRVGGDPGQPGGITGQERREVRGPLAGQPGDLERVAVQVGEI